MFIFPTKPRLRKMNIKKPTSLLEKFGATAFTIKWDNNAKAKSFYKQYEKLNE
jgi:hypothetical protein